MSFMGSQKKLGTFDTAEEAFAQYKEYKENSIKSVAEQYQGQMPDKVYEAMVNWKIEMGD